LVPPAGEPPRPPNTAPRLALLLVLAALVPLGLGTKSYGGPGQAWVHDNAGDILYAAFWLFALRLAIPHLALWKAAAWVFLFSTAIEFSQLVHAPLLDGLRRTLPGRLLLGTEFAWSDIGYYALGAALATVGSHLIAVPHTSRALHEP
jgi:hypothetical protein